MLEKPAARPVRDTSWNRAQVQFAAQQQVAAAKRAITSPYLVPGDKEALTLRIKHPSFSVTELARLAGMTKTAFAAKLRGACRRGPASGSGIRMPDEDRYIPAGAAARRVGVQTRDLRMLTRRGTLAGRRSHQKSFEYRAGDLDQVRQMLGETMAAVVDQLADMPS